MRAGPRHAGGERGIFRRQPIGRTAGKQERQSQNRNKVRNVKGPCPESSGRLLHGNGG